MWWRRLRYLLTLIALCAVATCPAAKRSCTAKMRAEEADDLVDALGDQIAKTVKATGRVPPEPAGLTPEVSCCDQGGTCKPDDKTWDTPGWRALAFSIDGPYRYRYQYIPDPSGTSAVVRAVGDVDCNGKSSVYELELHVKGDTVTRTWHRNDPYE
jgi:hypothetical protein